MSDLKTWTTNLVLTNPDKYTQKESAMTTELGLQNALRNHHLILFSAVTEHISQKGLPNTS
jgi:hypothetical protein